MRRELEFAKKIALIRKLFRAGQITEKEYIKIKSQLADTYGVFIPDATVTV